MAEKGLAEALLEALTNELAELDRRANAVRTLLETYQNGKPDGGGRGINLPRKPIQGKRVTNRERIMAVLEKASGPMPAADIGRALGLGGSVHTYLSQMRYDGSIKARVIQRKPKRLGYYVPA